MNRASTSDCPVSLILTVSVRSLTVETGGAPWWLQLVGDPGRGLSAAFATLARGPVQWKAEGVDNAEAEYQTEQPRPHGVGEGDWWSMRQEPMATACHVTLNGLHLEVRAYDAAHMEQLVTVTKVVEAARGETLGEVCGEEEGGEEGQRCVPAVQGVAAVVRAALTRTHQDPVEHRNVVEQVRVCKGQHAQHSSKLQTLVLRKSGVTGHTGADDGVEDCSGDVVLVESAVDPLVRENIR